MSKETEYCGRLENDDYLPYILPVLVDLQQNGAFGMTFNEVHNYGKLAAMGHAAPDAGTIDEAIKRGASMVTHFGNGR